MITKEFNRLISLHDHDSSKDRFEPITINLEKIEYFAPSSVSGMTEVSVGGKTFKLKIGYKIFESEFLEAFTKPRKPDMGPR